jgi:hypothetical protein
VTLVLFILLTYSCIQKITDKLQVVVVPGGQNFLFDLRGPLDAQAKAQ